MRRHLERYTGVYMCVALCLTWSLITLSALFIPAPEAIAQAPPKLAGSWICSGTNPDGSDYSLDLRVSELKDGYHFFWSHHDQPTQAGIGIVRAGHLIVSFWSPSTIGAADYQVSAGTLTGTWFMISSEHMWKTDSPDNWGLLAEEAIALPETCRMGDPV